MKLPSRQIEFDHSTTEGTENHLDWKFCTVLSLVFHHIYSGVFAWPEPHEAKKGPHFLSLSLHCVSPSSFLSSSNDQIILALSSNSQIVLYLFISSLYVYGRQHEVIIMRLADRGKVQLVIQLICISKSPSIFPSFWRATHSPLSSSL